MTKLSQNAHETAKTPKNRRPSYLPKRHRRFALFGLTQNGQETKACQLLLNVESPEDITVRVNKSLRNSVPKRHPIHEWIEKAYQVVKDNNSAGIPLEDIRKTSQLASLIIERVNKIYYFFGQGMLGSE